ncbi:hypothetical protein HEB94_001695 [Actinopolymorpha pittospori]|uniref:Uncharacterized protein n=1 Tax=Actinopolymorpha pittospori TaxID=648752 RepID=A0A927R6V5_9ACTN|nr:hypothetical protein [Actinopolymorpha pittospori]
MDVGDLSNDKANDVAYLDATKEAISCRGSMPFWSMPAGGTGSRSVTRSSGSSRAGRNVSGLRMR